MGFYLNKLFNSKLNMSSPLVTINSKEELDKCLEDQGKNLTVIHFSAEWADQCSQMNDVLVEISKQHQNVKYLVIDAENLSEISLEYEIEAVPTFLFMKNKQQIGRLNGAHALQCVTSLPWYQQLLGRIPRNNWKKD